MACARVAKRANPILCLAEDEEEEEDDCCSPPPDEKERPSSKVEVEVKLEKEEGQGALFKEAPKKP